MDPTIHTIKSIPGVVGRPINDMDPTIHTIQSIPGVVGRPIILWALLLIPLFAPYIIRPLYYSSLRGKGMGMLPEPGYKIMAIDGNKI